MDALDTLQLLTRQAELEGSEDMPALPIPTAISAACPDLSQRKRESIHIKQAQVTGAKPIRLLSTLLTSVCERNCNYCPFRSGRDFRRASFRPDEFAKTFQSLHKANLAEGLFLSSGIINGGIATQDKLLATAEILRHKLGYRGYLHLKIMPGAEKAQVERAMQLANRVSVNLEGPNPSRLSALAPRKQFLEELLQPLKWVEDLRQNRPTRTKVSSVTQFVVGAVGDTDLEVLQTSEYGYQKLHLQRVYYSRFKPLNDTPLEHTPEVPEIRQHRLYQASFLLRDYGFGLEDFAFDGQSNLPLDKDPKQFWADQNLSQRPIEINRAEKQELLRVPGIGPKGAEAILTARQKGTLGDLNSLRKLGILAERAVPYILLNGNRPEQQMRLF